MTNEIGDGITDKSWNRICKIGGITALLQVIAPIFTIAIAFMIGGEPATAEECFQLFQQNRLTGILRLDIVSIISMTLYYGTFLGMYAGLRKEKGAFALFGTIFAFIGITLWLSSNSVFSMIYLSDQYLKATTDVMRSQLIAAGTAVLASNMWHSTAAFVTGYLLLGSALYISILMLKSGTFGKVIGIIGIFANGLDLLHIIIGPLLPDISVVLMVIGGTFYLPWFLLIGLRLLKLARANEKELIAA